MHRDLAELENLGCASILQDTYLDDPEALKYPETPWQMLAVMADKVLDLVKQTVRLVGRFPLAMLLLIRHGKWETA